MPQPIPRKYFPWLFFASLFGALLLSVLFLFLNAFSVLPQHYLFFDFLPFLIWFFLGGFWYWRRISEDPRAIESLARAVTPAILASIGVTVFIFFWQDKDVAVWLSIALVFYALSGFSLFLLWKCAQQRNLQVRWKALLLAAGGLFLISLFSFRIAMSWGKAGIAGGALLLFAAWEGAKYFFLGKNFLRFNKFAYSFLVVALLLFISLLFWTAYVMYFFSQQILS